MAVCPLLAFKGIEDNRARRQGIVAPASASCRSLLRSIPPLSRKGLFRTLWPASSARSCRRAPLLLLARLARLAYLARLAVKECRARLLGKLEATGALGAGGNHDAVRHAVCRHVALVAALGAANKHGGLHSKAGLSRRERVRPESLKGLSAGKTA